MRNLRTGLIIYILTGISIIPIRYAYAQESETVVLDSLIDEALKNNPRIQAALHNWRAAEHKVKQARGLPDPEARFSYFGENIETRVGPQEAKYGLAQKIPFPGKLDLKGKIAGKLAQTMKEKYEATKREIIKNIKFVYYDIFWVERAIQITEEEKSILENLEIVAQRKYESNLAPQQDVIKAQVELSKLIDKLFVLQQNRKSFVAKMNSILNRPKGSQLGEVAGVRPLEFEYNLDELHEITRRSRQELLAADLDIERAKFERSLAGLDYFPDFTFGLDYIQVGDGHTNMPNDGQDAWMGKIAINIPIWFDRLSAQLNEKEANLEAAKKNYEDVSNRVSYEVEDLYFKITTYKDIISLYKTALIPQIEQAFEQARTGYETGAVDFLNWLDAERIVLQTRLAYYKAIVDYQKSIAYLERVVGRNL